MSSSVNDSPELPPNCSTWVDLLRYRALHQPNQLAFTFLQDGEIAAASLTYQALDQHSRAIAGQLQSLGLTGERALLLYPPGLDYLCAFFGCLYAGVVAVPAYPPRNHRNTPRIQAVIADAQAAIALSTTTISSRVRSLLAEKTDLDSLQWLTTDNLASGMEAKWQEPLIDQESLAFLQYTSGSTGTPKGAMLSHRNLLHNAAATYHYMGHSPNSKFVSWLPTYHDMGLIGGILQPLYGGFPCILMAPASFLQRPYRWLQAISQHQATTSGGPNFAYELCIEKITPEQRQTLDLSSWRVAFNGAEPVRQETLARFAEAFAACGFRREAFYPCYGLAEATLMVSGGVKSQVPMTLTVQEKALERHQVIVVSQKSPPPCLNTGTQKAESEATRTLVSCGCTLPDQQIVIANPETLVRCSPDEVGEVWVAGPSVGQGYWQRSQQTTQTFQAYLADTKAGPFLRTGDLGFLHDGELLITGRVKDLMIIRGRNLYPQDIELTAQRSHPMLRAGSVAAFTVEVGDEERLVVVQEVEFRQQPDVGEVTGAIRQAIAEEHEVQAHAVVLIKPGTIPKTSSGKIQRQACRAEFLADSLEVIGSSILDQITQIQPKVSLNRESLLAIAPEQRQALLESYLRDQAAQVLKVDSSQLDEKRSLSSLGLDSLGVAQLKNRIEVDLAVSLSVTDFFDGASITQLTAQILEQLAAVAAVVPALHPVPRNGELPLGLAQERLWFLDQLEPGNPFYNVPIAIRLTGWLKVDPLTQSLNAIIQRHEALRTCFVNVEGRSRQEILPSLTLTLPVIDLRHLPEPEREAEAQRLSTQETLESFNLAEGILLRAKLLRLTETEHLLLLSMHHIIADGWSIGVLIQELAALYEAFSSGKPFPFPELPIQYADFAHWQRQWLQGEVLETQLNYWRQQLSGNLPVLQLPTERPRPVIQSFRGARYPLVLSNQTLSEELKALNQQEDVTLFMTLLAAFKVLLYSYTGQEDILVGSPIAGRNRAEVEQLIGFFINTLVLRTDLSGNPSFRELLQRVRQVALGAYAHPDVPFEKLVEELQPERNLSYTPLFQVMFILQNAPIPTMELPDLTLQPLEVESGTAKFDLKLSLWESPDGLQGSFEYQTDLFDAMTIDRMATRFSTLLRHVVAHPDLKLKNLAAILTEAEQQQQRLKQQELETASLQKLKLARRKAVRN